MIIIIAFIEAESHLLSHICEYNKLNASLEYKRIRLCLLDGCSSLLDDE